MELYVSGRISILSISASCIPTMFASSETWCISLLQVNFAFLPQTLVLKQAVAFSHICSGWTLILQSATVYIQVFIPWGFTVIYNSANFVFDLMIEAEAFILMGSFLFCKFSPKKKKLLQSAAIFAEPCDNLWVKGSWMRATAKIGCGSRVHSGWSTFRQTRMICFEFFTLIEMCFNVFSNWCCLKSDWLG